MNVKIQFQKWDSAVSQLFIFYNAARTNRLSAACNKSHRSSPSVTTETHFTWVWARREWNQPHNSHCIIAQADFHVENRVLFVFIAKKSLQIKAKRKSCRLMNVPFNRTCLTSLSLSQSSRKCRISIFGERRRNSDLKMQLNWKIERRRKKMRNDTGSETWSRKKQLTIMMKPGHTSLCHRQFSGQTTL